MALAQTLVSRIIGIGLLTIGRATARPIGTYPRHSDFKQLLDECLATFGIEGKTLYAERCSAAVSAMLSSPRADRVSADRGDPRPEPQIQLLALRAKIAKMNDLDAVMQITGRRGRNPSGESNAD